eukprot:Skav205829  [mRNA]  locus=scaffold160:57004:58638:- [translate_table: standard]
MGPPWIQSDLNPGWLGSQAYKLGEVLEFVAYDEKGGKQGKALCQVLDVLSRAKKSCWLQVQMWCVEDQDLYWWLTKGPGKALKGVVELHVCEGSVRACPQQRKALKHHFHTDAMRVVDDYDLKRKTEGWWSASPAKKDFEAAVQKYLGKKKAEAVKEKGTGEEEIFPLEDDALAMPSGAEDEEVGEAPAASGATKKGGLAEKLTRLKEQVEGDRPAKAAKKAEAKEAPAKAKGAPLEREKEKEKEARTPRNKGGGWFGKDVPGGKKVAKAKSSSSGSSSKEGKKKKKKKKVKKDKKEKKKKTDRGPFGSGRKVAYGRDVATDEEEDAESDYSSESDFQKGAPEKRSHQLILMEYADLKPGRLASRMMQKMASMTNRTGAPSRSVLAAQNTSTPSVAVQYYQTLLFPQHKEKLSVRVQREIRTLAQVLDHLGVGEVERSADLVSQRLKAIELSVQDQGWHRAQYVELIPLESDGLADIEEVRTASREQLLESKMRRYQGGGKPNRDYGREADKGFQKGRGKEGQKKGKGKGRGQGALPDDKTPAA